MGTHLQQHSERTASHASSNGGAIMVAKAPRTADPELEHSHQPIQYSPQTRWGVIVFALVVAAALCIIFALVHHSHATAEANLKAATDHMATASIGVDVVPVSRAGAQKVITLPGNVISFHEATIYARVSGFLQDWKHDFGDSVKEGEVLADIDTPELDQQLAEAKAKVAQLESEVNVAIANANFAKKSYDRWELAYKDLQGSVSQQERDEKKAELDSDNAKVLAAKSAVALAQADENRLKAMEKFKQVRAPFDGVVTGRTTDIGQLVTAGSTANTSPLFSMSQANKVRIYVDVPEPVVPEIHLNMQATTTARELPGELFTGIVDRDSHSVDPHSRMLTVEVLVPNPGLKLMPGMYVQVTFKTSRQNPPLTVPASALTFAAHGPQVAVVRPDGKIFFRNVTISRDMGDSVELESGVKEGELVALNVGNQVVDGQTVDVHRLETAPAPRKAVSPSPRTVAEVQPTLKTQLGH